MKDNKKLALLVLCAGISSQAAIASEEHTRNYHFLAAGPEVQRWTVGSFTTTSKVSGYLHGGYSFNNILVEARLRYFPESGDSDLSAGVGYYFPLGENSSLYVQGVFSKQRNFQVSHTTSPNHVHIDLLPDLEVGYRANLNDVTGVRLAYRLLIDSRKTSTLTNGRIKSSDSLFFAHAFSTSAYYHLTPQLAAEISYTFITRFGSPINEHRSAVGLRYAF